MVVLSLAEQPWDRERGGNIRLHFVHSYGNIHVWTVLPSFYLWLCLKVKVPDKKWTKSHNFTWRFSRWKLPKTDGIKWRTRQHWGSRDTHSAKLEGVGSSRNEQGVDHSFLYHQLVGTRGAVLDVTHVSAAILPIRQINLKIFPALHLQLRRPMHLNKSQFESSTVSLPFHQAEAEILKEAFSPVGRKEESLTGNCTILHNYNNFFG